MAWGPGCLKKKKIEGDEVQFDWVKLFVSWTISILLSKSFLLISLIVV